MSEIDVNSEEDEVKIKSIGTNLEELIGSTITEIKLNTRHRQLIFILLGLVYCISSSDGGIVPQQNKNMQYNFEDEGETRVGLFGSIDYVGRIIGAVVMSLLINRLDRQVFYSGCCLIKAITLFVSTCTENYHWNLISRLISGIPQTMLTAYGTIWTDQFGRRKKRSLMLALFQLFALGGILVGYGIGLICDAIVKIPEQVKKYGEKDNKYTYEYFYLGWRLAFSIEGVILAILGLVLFFCPKIFFSRNFYLNDDNDKEGDDNIGRERPMKSKENENNDKNEDDEKKNKFKKIVLLFKQLPKILCTKIYIFMSIGNTIAFFGMRIIQFYADKYMEVVLNVEPEAKHVYFIVLCITGPIFGVLIVGVIMQKIGGYGSRKGMILIIILNAIAAFVSLLFTATLNTFVSLASAWIYLFCLAAVTPLQGGVIIASLPKELKGNGYSVNMFFLNALGSFPSSYVFALICDFIKDNFDDSNMRYRTSMRIVMFYNFVGLLLIIIAGIFRFRIKGDLDIGQKDENKQQIKDENKEQNKEENNRLINNDEIKEDNKEEIKVENKEEKKEEINEENKDENKEEIKEPNKEDNKEENMEENKEENIEENKEDKTEEDKEN